MRLHRWGIVWPESCFKNVVLRSSSERLSVFIPSMVAVQSLRNEILTIRYRVEQLLHTHTSGWFVVFHSAKYSILFSGIDFRCFIFASHQFSCRQEVLLFMFEI